jgi:hypothetical protein
LHEKELKSQKYLSLTITATDFIFILLLLLLLIPNLLFHGAFAASPAFDQTYLTDAQLGKTDWVQTYGNDSTHLKSDYANILAVDYVSNGKTLNVTLWLKSNLENASTYSQPFKKIRYGMLIAINSLPTSSGYNGANYNFYIEAINGKWSEYLYQLSATGSSALVVSKKNFTESYDGTTIGPGYVKLRLDLDSIDNPSAYGLSFYTAESFKSNEVRDFTNWVTVPPKDIVDILTHPKDIVIRQGETHLIPAEINTPDLIENVTSISFDNGTDFSSNGLHVSTERIQPLLFKVEVSPQTTVGVYTIFMEASMLISITAPTGPTTNGTDNVDKVNGVVDPEFQVSQKYPTIGYINSPANITIDVLPSLTFNEQLAAFWGSYGDFISILCAGAVGSFSSFFIDYVKTRKKNK